jgi:hypothetical protein
MSIKRKTVAVKWAGVVAALCATAACGGPGADPAPTWPDARVTVVPLDDELERLLRGADETWEGVGVHSDEIAVAAPGPDDGAAGTVPVMWSTVAELSTLYGERGVVGAVYWAGGVVFIAQDAPASMLERVAVHELGHLIAPDRDDLPCPPEAGGAMAGMMCDGMAAPLPTHADVDWICSSDTKPCRSVQP